MDAHNSVTRSRIEYAKRKRQENNQDTIANRKGGKFVVLQPENIPLPEEGPDEKM